jgi:integrase
MTTQPANLNTDNAIVESAASAVTIGDDYRAILLERVENKDAESRIKLYLKWLEATTPAGSKVAWDEPDLAAYRDYLLHEYVGRNDKRLTNASAAAHLSTIRGRYQAILSSNKTLDAWEHRALIECEKYGIDPSPANIQAAVQRAKTRLENAINPTGSTVTVIRKRDEGDGDHIRLTFEQANALLAAPFEDKRNTPLQAIRDTAIIAVMLCTGIREMELCALDVSDLRDHFGGALALNVREGKGMVQRRVPYGAGEWCLAYVDKWMEMVGITSGAVFRGFYKGGKSVRSTRLDVSSIQDILNRYPVMIDGQLVAINPHDTRRSYARRAYDTGVSLLAIQQNLGHSDSRVSERYVGTLDASARKPPAMYTPPRLRDLDKLTLL